ncbi:MAG: hypothetical protein ACFHHU_16455 [Porticoccaceae bacterium]|uniref:hypothetical protein n=1 Tax=Thalassospira sp. TaxID=1912094 RepID=UPI003A883DA0
MRSGVGAVFQAKMRDSKLVWVSYSLAKDGSVEAKENLAFFDKPFTYILEKTNFYSNEYKVINEFFSIRSHDFFVNENNTESVVFYSQKIFSAYSGWWRDFISYSLPFPDISVDKCIPFPASWRFNID